MIDKNSAVYSLPLAVICAKKGLVVSPVPGTPVSELVKITNDLAISAGTCVPADATQDDLLECFTDDLSRLTTNNEITTTHDDLMDGYIHQISEAVRNHISFAKNVVRPVIMEVVEETQKTLCEVVLPSSQFKIEVVDLPKPMQNAGFESSISKYSDKPFLVPEREFRLAEIAPQSILTLMQTGSKEYDERINEWFVNKGDLFFMDIWNNLFRDFKESKPSVVFNFNQCMGRDESAVDCALAVQLLSRKLFDEIPENTGMELHVYRDLMAQYRDASGVRLATEYNRYESILRNKTLVIDFSPSGKECRVNGAIYRQWLKDGGNNDILLGLMVSGKMVFSQNLIDAEKEKFLSDWSRFSLFSATAEKNRAFSKFKDALVISFGNSMKETSAEEKEIIAKSPSYIDKVTNVLNEEINKLVTKDMSDIFTTCLRLVCRARFYYTDAEKILVGINEAFNVNNNIEVREAALVSTIEYVVDYISDQLKITTI